MRPLPPHALSPAEQARIIALGLPALKGPDINAGKGAGGATQEKLEKSRGTTPLGRAGQPMELGSIYVQLFANDASFATGQIYGVAGGGCQP